MIIAAFDPGLSGALAVSSSAKKAVGVCDLPLVGQDKQTLINGVELARVLQHYEVEHVVIERVASMPGQGVSSTFKFGTTFGQIIGVVQALSIPHEFASPAKWKREMRVPGKNDGGAEVARARAIELFPALAGELTRKKDHNRAEALLLGRWWWEKEKQR